MKRIRIFLLAIIMFTTLASCASTTGASTVQTGPEGAVQGMIEAANKGDSEAFMKYWDTESNTYKACQNFIKRKMALDTKRLYACMNMPAEIDHFIVQSAKVAQSDETAATVGTDLEVWAGFDPPHKVDETLQLNFYLIKKEGNWYITKLSDKDK